MDKLYQISFKKRTVIDNSKMMSLVFIGKQKPTNTETMN